MASYGNNTFQYGADGIRYKKNNTKYTLDGNKILRETDGTKTIKYYYGHGGVVGFNYNGTDYYYEKNLQGDITAIYNTSGVKQAEYVYDAWGKIVSMTDSAGNDISNNTSHVGYLNPFRYRGYYYDVETNLYYLESRYYDPETGRFLNADSLSYLGDGDELSNYNLYAYCGNNSVMYKDPSGHFAISAIVIGALIGIAVAFSATAYADYEDDGEVFNGSISGEAYLGNTLVGGVIGALLGGFSTLSFSVSIPTGFAFMQTTIGTTEFIIGTATITITGAQILGVAGVGGAAHVLAKTWKSGGYKIRHYPNDHDPAHVHMTGDDIGEIRVDLSGNPLKGEDPLTSGAKKAFWKLIEEILRYLGEL